MSSERDPVAEPQYCAYTTYEYRGETVREGVPQLGEAATGLEREVWDALYEVEDPEMPVSIVDLGLIYGLSVEEDESGEQVAYVRMTLTYSGCPARDMLQEDVERAAASPEGIDRVELELVWSPAWRMEFVSEQGRADLQEFGVSV